MIRTFLLVPS